MNISQCTNKIWQTFDFNFKRTWTHVHVRYVSSSVRLSSVCLSSV